MKTMMILMGILVVVFLLFGVTVSFRPFRVSLTQPYYAVGWVLIVVGVAFVRYEGKRDGFKKGVDSVIETIKDINDENIKS